MNRAADGRPEGCLTAMEAKAIGLEGLSARQRQVVEAHLPLVQLTLRRYGQGGEGRYGGARSQVRDLAQEACLALIEAVRRHDPARHGAFAPYAMSRMRFAISQFAHENQGIVRVPYVAQRRARGKGFLSAELVPRATSMKDARHDGPAERSSKRFKNPFERPGARRWIEEAVRERCERAMRQAAQELKRDPRAARGTAAVVDRCAAERWHVPEPDAKTPIRELARAMGCSLGRVTHCEARFYRRVAELLREDGEFARLRARLRAMEGE